MTYCIENPRFGTRHLLKFKDDQAAIEYRDEFHPNENLYKKVSDGQFELVKDVKDENL